MYVRDVTEARSRNHSCRGKGISITYSECVSVALVIQHAKRMRRFTCRLWPVWLYHIFPHYLINGTILETKVIEHKMCVLILPTTFV
jgi:hypothetical protein